MVMQRASKAPLTPTQTLACHYKYEVDLLNATYAYLADGHYDKVISNALIESFCIHGRALMEFFHKGEEERGAQRYTDGGYNPLHIERGRNSLWVKLNNQIAHLRNDERACDDKDKIGPLERAELMDILAKHSQGFRAHMKAEYSTLQLPAIEQQVITSVTSTGTTSSFAEEFRVVSVGRADQR
jgi:hypothetical protein